MKQRFLAAVLALCAVLTLLPGTALAASYPKKEFNGHTYQVIEAPLNWNEAKLACERLGGHLVTVTSAAEQSFLESLIKDGTKNHYWLGATGRAGGTWQWVTNEQFSYSNWDRSEPNNYLRQEGYVQIYRVRNPAVSGSQAFRWNDISLNCTTNSAEAAYFNLNMTGYVCEWDSVQQVTVIFDPNGGTVTPSSRTYAFNAALGTLPVPKRTGYTFQGWYTAKTSGGKVGPDTRATLSRTLYAHWVKSAVTDHTLTFDANGGYCSEKTRKVPANTAYGPLPAPTRTGYTLSGWYTAKTGGTKVSSTTKAAASRTLYARWSKVSRSKLVRFDANGGDVLLDAKYVTKGSPYGSLPTPSRPGYHFSGWYSAKTGGARITETTRVDQTGARTLYAHWTSSVRQNSAVSGSWTVTVPCFYTVPLYSTSTSAAYASCILERSSAYAISCTRRAVLSNGTTRYLTRYNGQSRWFTYTCEMTVR